MRNMTFPELRVALADIPQELEVLETTEGWFLVWRQGERVISADIRTWHAAYEDNPDIDEDDGA